MNKRNIVLVSIVVVILIVICTITGTYAVIINVINENGTDKIVNEIDIIDLVTNDDGTYNDTYYSVKNELDITESEADLLITSIPLNKTLDDILKSVIEYKLHNNNEARYSNDELCSMIEDAVNKTTTLSTQLKNKVLEKLAYYKQDVSDYVYDIEVVSLGDS